MFAVHCQYGMCSELFQQCDWGYCDLGRLSALYDQYHASRGGLAVVQARACDCGKEASSFSP